MSVGTYTLTHVIHHLKWKKRLIIFYTSWSDMFIDAAFKWRPTRSYVPSNIFLVFTEMVEYYFLICIIEVIYLSTNFL